MSTTTPQEHAQQVARFRSEIIGSLRHRALSRGQLQQELHRLSEQPYRPPGSPRSVRFSVPTLQRWYYAYKNRGLSGLVPKLRKDRGRGRKLAPPLRTLLLDIKREHPQASVPLILRTLQHSGRMTPGEVGPATVRRLFVEHGLDRAHRPDTQEPPQRLRWESAGPNALWHSDVCHGPTLQIAGKPFPLRIHALLDDASRFVLDLVALDHEREEAMLHLLVRAMRAHGRPSALYLDNGSTYSGHQLRTVCERLDITLLHAKPYDPQARGKMERFWRTLRQGCLAFLPTATPTSVTEVEQRLNAFVQQHYQGVPHASLMGKSPLEVYGPAQRTALPVDQAQLTEALTLRKRRRVRNDSTLSIDGVLYEVEQSYLGGRLVTVATCLLDGLNTSWVEHEGRRLRLLPCDPRRNGKRRRSSGTAPQGAARPGGHVPFDPLAQPLPLCPPAATETADDDDDLSDIF